MNWSINNLQTLHKQNIFKLFYYVLSVLALWFVVVTSTFSDGGKTLRETV